MNKPVDKVGGLRQFQVGDRGMPHAGWWPINKEPYQGFVNPRGFAALHVVVQKALAGQPVQDLYDQFLIIENPGAVVVCREGDKVGLVWQFRFTAERLLALKDANSDYVRRLAEEARWDELMASLGRWQLELPRGLWRAEAAQNLSQFILTTAKVEAKDEAGFSIKRPRICGRINPNSTFFAHAQYVVTGTVSRKQKARPEAAEMIGQVCMLSKKELRSLADAGQFDDGFSLAALQLAKFHF